MIAVCAGVLTIGLCGITARGAEQQDLRAFYQTHCAGCHGVDGAARDANGKGLKGQDFTDARWLKDARDASMVKVILKGKFFGLAMPAYKDKLTADEAQRLVTDVIRQAVKGKTIAPTPAATGGK
jgi:mono/diheme cytochrome c family protein